MNTAIIQADAIPLLIVGLSSGGFCFLIGFFTCGLFATRRPKPPEFRHRVFNRSNTQDSSR